MLSTIAEELALTPNQVLLAWLTGIGVIPVTVASTEVQMVESMGASDLALSNDMLDRLDCAGAEP